MSQDWEERQRLRSSIVNDETKLCCYPDGTSLTLSTNAEKRKKLLIFWILGTVITILGIAYIFNHYFKWSDQLSSLVFYQVYNKAVKFDDCPIGTFIYCSENKKCISHSQRCDRFQDCPDDKDEIDCECFDDEFSCRHGRCISEMFLCDGVKDCPEGDDEKKVLCGRCKKKEFRCKGIDIICLDEGRVCDDVQDCSAGDDETNCVFFKQNNELKIRHKLLEASVCYSSWKKELDVLFCEMSEKGPPHRRFPLQAKKASKKAEISFSLQKNYALGKSKPRYFLKPVGNCKENKVVALICEDEECGGRKISDSHFKNYIINGNVASRGEFPWTAFLVCSGLKCGASLLNDQWVITAGHCVFKDSNILNAEDCLVYLGSTNLKDSNWEIFTVIEIIQHEDYDDSVLDNDLALLKLKNKVQFTPFIQPICLPHKPFVQNDFLYCYSVGFGTTILDESSDVLLKTRMKQRKEWAPKFRMCIGTEAGNKHSNLCMGDSGGGFLCRSRLQNKWTLIGINSYITETNPTKSKGGDRKKKIPSAKDCQNSFVTKIYSYLKWIENQIEDI